MSFTEEFICDSDKYEKQMIGKLRTDREDVQAKTYRNWINSVLIKARTNIDDIYVDLQDGQKLITLLEVITGEKVAEPNKGTNRLHKIENVSQCLHFIKEKVYLESIGPEDIVDGKKRLTLGLIWTIILRFQLSQHFEAATFDLKSIKDSLLAWCQSKTSKQTKCQIRDFNKSWTNGWAFVELIRSFRPDIIDSERLSHMKGAEVLEYAFDVAHQHLMIPKLLDAEDVANSVDENSLLTYISYFYNLYCRTKGTETSSKRIKNILTKVSEIQNSQQTYEVMVAELLTWIRHKCTELESEFDIDQAGQQMANFNDYFQSERPLKLKSRNECESVYFEILSQQKTLGMRPFMPPTGHTVKDIERAWLRLEHIETSRQEKLKNSLNKCAHLNRVLEAFDAKCLKLESHISDKLEKLNQIFQWDHGVDLTKLDMHLKQSELICCDISSSGAKFDSVFKLADELIEHRFKNHDFTRMCKTHLKVKLKKLTDLAEHNHRTIESTTRLIDYLRQLDCLQSDLSRMQIELTALPTANRTHSAQNIFVHLEKLKQHENCHRVLERQFLAIESRICHLTDNNNQCSGTILIDPRVIQSKLTSLRSLLDINKDSIERQLRDSHLNLDFNEFKDEIEFVQMFCREKQILCQSHMEECFDRNSIVYLQRRNNIMKLEISTIKEQFFQTCQKGYRLVKECDDYAPFVSSIIEQTNKQLTNSIQLINERTFLISDSVALLRLSDQLAEFDLSSLGDNFDQLQREVFHIIKSHDQLATVDLFELSDLIEQINSLCINIEQPSAEDHSHVVHLKEYSMEQCMGSMNHAFLVLRIDQPIHFLRQLHSRLLRLVTHNFRTAQQLLSSTECDMDRNNFRRLLLESSQSSPGESRPEKESIGSTIPERLEDTEQMYDLFLREGNLTQFIETLQERERNFQADMSNMTELMTVIRNSLHLLKVTQTLTRTFVQVKNDRHSKLEKDSLRKAFEESRSHKITKPIVTTDDTETDNSASDSLHGDFNSELNPQACKFKIVTYKLKKNLEFVGNYLGKSNQKDDISDIRFKFDFSSKILQKDLLQIDQMLKEIPTSNPEISAEVQKTSDMLTDLSKCEQTMDNKVTTLQSMTEVKSFLKTLTENIKEVELIQLEQDRTILTKNITKLRSLIVTMERHYEELIKDNSVLMAKLKGEEKDSRDCEKRITCVKQTFAQFKMMAQQKSDQCKKRLSELESEVPQETSIPLKTATPPPSTTKAVDLECEQIKNIMRQTEMLIFEIESSGNVSQVMYDEAVTKCDQILNSSTSSRQNKLREELCTTKNRLIRARAIRRERDELVQFNQRSAQFISSCKADIEQMHSTNLMNSVDRLIVVREWRQRHEHFQLEYKTICELYRKPLAAEIPSRVVYLGDLLSNHQRQVDAMQAFSEAMLHLENIETRLDDKLLNSDTDDSQARLRSLIDEIDDLLRGNSFARLERDDAELIRRRAVQAKLKCLEAQIKAKFDAIEKSLHRLPYPDQRPISEAIQDQIQLIDASRPALQQDKNGHKMNEFFRNCLLVSNKIENLAQLICNRNANPPTLPTIDTFTEPSSESNLTKFSISQISTVESLRPSMEKHSEKPLHAQETSQVTLLDENVTPPNNDLRAAETPPFIANDQFEESNNDNLQLLNDNQLNKSDLALNEKWNSASTFDILSDENGSYLSPESGDRILPNGFLGRTSSEDNVNHYLTESSNSLYYSESDSGHCELTYHLGSPEEHPIDGSMFKLPESSFKNNLTESGEAAKSLTLDFVDKLPQNEPLNGSDLQNYKTNQEPIGDKASEIFSNRNRNTLIDEQMAHTCLDISSKCDVLTNLISNIHSKIHFLTDDDNLPANLKNELSQISRSLEGALEQTATDTNELGCWKQCIESMSENDANELPSKTANLQITLAQLENQLQNIDQQVEQLQIDLEQQKSAQNKHEIPETFPIDTQSSIGDEMDYNSNVEEWTNDSTLDVRKNSLDPEVIDSLTNKINSESQIQILTENVEMSTDDQLLPHEVFSKMNDGDRARLSNEIDENEKLDKDSLVENIEKLSEKPDDFNPVKASDVQNEVTPDLEKTTSNKSSKYIQSSVVMSDAETQHEDNTRECLTAKTAVKIVQLVSDSELNRTTTEMQVHISESTEFIHTETIIKETIVEFEKKTTSDDKIDNQPAGDASKNEIVIEDISEQKSLEASDDADPQLISNLAIENVMEDNTGNTFASDVNKRLNLDQSHLATENIEDEQNELIEIGENLNSEENIIIMKSDSEFKNTSNEIVGSSVTNEIEQPGALIASEQNSEIEENAAFDRKESREEDQQNKDQILSVTDEITPEKLSGLPCQKSIEIEELEADFTMPDTLPQTTVESEATILKREPLVNEPKEDLLSNFEHTSSTTDSQKENLDGNQVKGETNVPEEVSDKSNKKRKKKKKAKRKTETIQRGYSGQTGIETLEENAPLETESDFNKTVPELADPSSENVFSSETGSKESQLDVDQRTNIEDLETSDLKESEPKEQQNKNVQLPAITDEATEEMLTCLSPQKSIENENNKTESFITDTLPVITVEPETSIESSADRLDEGLLAEEPNEEKISDNQFLDSTTESKIDDLTDGSRTKVEPPQTATEDGQNKSNKKRKKTKKAKRKPEIIQRGFSGQTVIEAPKEKSETESDFTKTANELTDSTVENALSNEPTDPLTSADIDEHSDNQNMLSDTDKINLDPCDKVLSGQSEVVKANMKIDPQSLSYVNEFDPELKNVEIKSFDESPSDDEMKPDRQEISNEWINPELEKITDEFNQNSNASQTITTQFDSRLEKPTHDNSIPHDQLQDQAEFIQSIEISTKGKITQPTNSNTYESSVEIESTASIFDQSIQILSNDAEFPAPASEAVSESLNIRDDTKTYNDSTNFPIDAQLANEEEQEIVDSSEKDIQDYHKNQLTEEIESQTDSISTCPIAIEDSLHASPNDTKDLKESHEKSAGFDPVKTNEEENPNSHSITEFGLGSDEFSKKNLERERDKIGETSVPENIVDSDSILKENLHIKLIEASNFEPCQTDSQIESNRPVQSSDHLLTSDTFYESTEISSQHDSIDLTNPLESLKENKFKNEKDKSAIDETGLPTNTMDETIQSFVKDPNLTGTGEESEKNVLTSKQEADQNETISTGVMKEPSVLSHIEPPISEVTTKSDNAEAVKTSFNDSNIPIDEQSDINQDKILDKSIEITENNSNIALPAESSFAPSESTQLIDTQIDLEENIVSDTFDKRWIISENPAEITTEEVDCLSNEEKTQTLDAEIITVEQETLWSDQPMTGLSDEHAVGIPSSTCDEINQTAADVSDAGIQCKLDNPSPTTDLNLVQLKNNEKTSTDETSSLEEALTESIEKDPIDATTDEPPESAANDYSDNYYESHLEKNADLKYSPTKFEPEDAQNEKIPIASEVSLSAENSFIPPESTQSINIENILEENIVSDTFDKRWIISEDPTQMTPEEVEFLPIKDQTQKFNQEEFTAGQETFRSDQVLSYSNDENAVEISLKTRDEINQTAADVSDAGIQCKLDNSSPATDIIQLKDNEKPSVKGTPSPSENNEFFTTQANENDSNEDSISQLSDSIANEYSDIESDFEQNGNQNEFGLEDAQSINEETLDDIENRVDNIESQVANLLKLLESLENSKSTNEEIGLIGTLELIENAPTIKESNTDEFGDGTPPGENFKLKDFEDARQNIDDGRKLLDSLGEKSITKNDATDEKVSPLFGQGTKEQISPTTQTNEHEIHLQNEDQEQFDITAINNSNLDGVGIICEKISSGRKIKNDNGFGKNEKTFQSDIDITNEAEIIVEVERKDLIPDDRNDNQSRIEAPKNEIENALDDNSEQNVIKNTKTDISDTNQPIFIKSAANKVESGEDLLDKEQFIKESNEENLSDNYFDATTTSQLKDLRNKNQVKAEGPQSDAPGDVPNKKRKKKKKIKRKAEIIQSGQTAIETHDDLAAENAFSDETDPSESQHAFDQRTNIENLVASNMEESESKEHEIQKNHQLQSITGETITLPSQKPTDNEDSKTDLIITPTLPQMTVESEEKNIATCNDLLDKRQFAKEPNKEIFDNQFYDSTAESQMDDLMEGNQAQVEPLQSETEDVSNKSNKKRKKTKKVKRKPETIQRGYSGQTVIEASEENVTLDIESEITKSSLKLGETEAENAFSTEIEPIESQFPFDPSGTKESKEQQNQNVQLPAVTDEIVQEKLNCLSPQKSIENEVIETDLLITNTLPQTTDESEANNIVTDDLLDEGQFDKEPIEEGISDNRLLDSTTETIIDDLTDGSRAQIELPQTETEDVSNKSNKKRKKTKKAKRKSETMQRSYSGQIVIEAPKEKPESDFTTISNELADSTVENALSNEPIEPQLPFGQKANIGVVNTFDLDEPAALKEEQQNIDEALSGIIVVQPEKLANLSTQESVEKFKPDFALIDTDEHSDNQNMLSETEKSNLDICDKVSPEQSDVVREKANMKISLRQFNELDPEFANAQNESPQKILTDNEMKSDKQRTTNERKKHEFEKMANEFNQISNANYANSEKSESDEQKQLQTANEVFVPQSNQLIDLKTIEGNQIDHDLNISKEKLADKQETHFISADANEANLENVEKNLSINSLKENITNIVSKEPAEFELDPSRSTKTQIGEIITNENEPLPIDRQSGSKKTNSNVSQIESDRSGNLDDTYSVDPPQQTDLSTKEKLDQLSDKSKLEERKKVNGEFPNDSSSYNEKFPSMILTRKGEQMPTTVQTVEDHFPGSQKIETDKTKTFISEEEALAELDSKANQFSNSALIADSPNLAQPIDNEGTSKLFESQVPIEIVNENEKPTELIFEDTVLSESKNNDIVPADIKMQFVPSTIEPEMSDLTNKKQPSEKTNFDETSNLYNPTAETKQLFESIENRSSEDTLETEQQTIISPTTIDIKPEQSNLLGEHDQHIADLTELIASPGSTRQIAHKETIKSLDKQTIDSFGNEQKIADGTFSQDKSQLPVSQQDSQLYQDFSSKCNGVEERLQIIESKVRELCSQLYISPEALVDDSSNKEVVSGLSENNLPGASAANITKISPNETFVESNFLSSLNRCNVIDSRLNELDQQLDLLRSALSYYEQTNRNVLASEAESQTKIWKYESDTTQVIESIDEQSENVACEQNDIIAFGHEVANLDTSIDNLPASISDSDAVAFLPQKAIEGKSPGTVVHQSGSLEFSDANRDEIDDLFHKPLNLVNSTDKPISGDSEAAHQSVGIKPEASELILAEQMLNDKSIQSEKSVLEHKNKLDQLDKSKKHIEINTQNSFNEPNEINQFPIASLSNLNREEESSQLFETSFEPVTAKEGGEKEANEPHVTFEDLTGQGEMSATTDVNVPSFGESDVTGAYLPCSLTESMSPSTENEAHDVPPSYESVILDDDLMEESPEPTQVLPVATFDHTPINVNKPQDLPIKNIWSQPDESNKENMNENKKDVIDETDNHQQSQPYQGHIGWNESDDNEPSAQSPNNGDSSWIAPLSNKSRIDNEEYADTLPIANQSPSDSESLNLQIGSENENPPSSSLIIGSEGSTASQILTEESNFDNLNSEQIEGDLTSLLSSSDEVPLEESQAEPQSVSSGSVPFIENLRSSGEGMLSRLRRIARYALPFHLLALLLLLFMLIYPQDEYEFNCLFRNEYGKGIVKTYPNGPPPV